MTDNERNTDTRVLIMAADDNVAIARTDLAAGTTLQVMGSDITLRDKVLTGHKFAFIPVEKGATIVKYGAPIGIATADVAPGDAMHLHNIVSDYIPTYTFDEGHQFLEE